MKKDHLFTLGGIFYERLHLRSIFTTIEERVRRIIVIVVVRMNSKNIFLKYFKDPTHPLIAST